MPKRAAKVRRPELGAKILYTNKSGAARAGFVSRVADEKALLIDAHIMSQPYQPQEVQTVVGWVFLTALPYADPPRPGTWRFAPASA